MFKTNDVYKILFNYSLLILIICFTCIFFLTTSVQAANTIEIQETFFIDTASGMHYYPGENFPFTFSTTPRISVTFHWDVDRYVHVLLLATNSSYLGILGDFQNILYEDWTSSSGDYTYNPINLNDIMSPGCSEVIICAVLFDPATGKPLYTDYAYWPVDVDIYGGSSWSTPPTTYETKRDISDLLNGTFSYNYPKEIYQLYLFHYDELNQNLSQDIIVNTDGDEQLAVEAFLSLLFKPVGICYSLYNYFIDGLSGNSISDIVVDLCAIVLDGVDILYKGAKSVDRWCEYIAKMHRCEAYGMVLRIFEEEYDSESPIINSVTIEPNDGGLIPVITGIVTIAAEVTDDFGIRAVEFYLDNQKIGEDNTFPYELKFDTVIYNSGNHIIEIVAFDFVDNSDSAEIECIIQKTLIILPNTPDPSTTVTSLWSVSGNVKDGNESNVSGASINVFLEGYSQSWGSGTTDSNGNYSISNIPAPKNDGSYTITIEASAGGTTGSNSSQTLTVNDPKVGHDLALNGFEVEPMSITPGGALTLNALGITNKGEYNEEFDLIFELKYPDGSLCTSKTKHLSLEAGHSLGWQSETLSSNSAVSGNYTAMVRIDCPYDSKPEDNESSLSVYVGQIQNYTQYKGDYVCCNIDNPTMTYGAYKLNVLYIGSYFRADVLKNNSIIASSVRFDYEVPHYFDGNQLLIFCYISDSSSQNACAFMGTPNSVPFTYTPSTPHFSQGTTGILKVECATSSEFRYFYDSDIVLTDDVSTVRDWYDRETFINDWEVNRKFNIPASQATGTYTVWFSESLFGGDYVYLKKLDFVIEKAHDAFVNSISTKVDGVEKTEFDIGEDVTITANVGVSGGYTEEVNVVLSITGPNGYYYPDSKDRIESKATISSTSQDIAFDPWNTSGLVPGNYTISVTANMGADINSGNNTKTKAVVIKELPALIVNGQTDKTTYDQGEQIKLTATVTDPNTNPVNDATVTATITWPDLTESNPALSYNADSGKYEHIFNATQFGSYAIELRAVKTNYGTGTKELPTVTVNNTPPDTTINNVVPSEGQTINSNSVIFSWTGSDSGTPAHHLAYSWKLDEGSYSAFSTNTIIELNELSDGPHTFYVKAFDGVLEDPTPAQRSFIVDTSEPPEVYLSKTANKTTVTPGEVVTYTIIYDNDGAGPAKNAVIEDVIPANTTYIGGSASSGNVIHTGNTVVEIKVNSVWEPDSASPSGEVTAVRWTFDSDIAVDDGDNYGTVEDESPNSGDVDAGTVTLQVTVD